MSKRAHKKDRKVHVDISPENWQRLEIYVEAYNADPQRVTPPIRVKHVINQALHRFFSRVD